MIHCRLYDPTLIQNILPACAYVKTQVHRSSAQADICCRSKGQRLKECSVLNFTNNRVSYLDAAIVCVYSEGAKRSDEVCHCRPVWVFFTQCGMMCELVFCVTAQRAHCLSHNAPFSCGPLSLLSDGARTHFVLLANHHHWDTNHISTCWMK